MFDFKKYWQGIASPFVRFVIVAVSVFLILICFVRENNLVRWARAEFELRSQRRQIERYQKDINKMDKQIQSLTNDRDTLEQFARENFNFARPGEDVYILR